jgi:hypothetical protein
MRMRDVKRRDGRATTRGERIAVSVTAAVVGVLALSACGGSSPVLRTAPVSEPGAITISEQAEIASEARSQICDEERIPSPTCIAEAEARAARPTVTECVHGVDTNSSCVFAKNVYNAFRKADVQGGPPPKSLAAPGMTPVSCSVQGQDTWRCNGRVNPRVWVTFRIEDPNGGGT